MFITVPLGGNVTLIGGSLKKTGVLNETPNLYDLDESGDLKYSVDFRSVYATILDNWLEVDDKMVLNSNFDKLGFVQWLLTDTQLFTDKLH